MYDSVFVSVEVTKKHILKGRIDGDYPDTNAFIKEFDSGGTTTKPRMVQIRLTKNGYPFKRNME